MERGSWLPPPHHPIHFVFARVFGCRSSNTAFCLLIAVLKIHANIFHAIAFLSLCSTIRTQFSPSVCVYMCLFKNKSHSFGAHNTSICCVYNCCIAYELHIDTMFQEIRTNLLIPLICLVSIGKWRYFPIKQMVNTQTFWPVRLHDTPSIFPMFQRTRFSVFW